MKEVEINGLRVNISTEDFEYPTEYNIISGGRDAMLWDDYFELFKDITKPYIELIKAFVIENELTQITAEEFANENTFVFSDGTKIGFSWRGWGDFLSALNNKMEGYMKYYML